MRDAFVEVATAEGQRRTRVAFTRGGLAVTEALRHYGWVITHLASGRCFEMTPRRTRAETKRLLLAVLPLADWTQPMSTLLAERRLAGRVRAACKRAEAREARP